MTFSFEINLPLSFGKATTLIFGNLANAAWAVYAGAKIGMLLIGFGDRPSAGITKIVLSDLQSMTDRDAAIKHKAFALPLRLFRRHHFKVL